MTDQILFFPFTHISQNQLNTVFSFFSSFQYFPITGDFKHDPGLQKLFEQKKISPVFSSKEEMELLDQKTGQYMEWARLHKGGHRGNGVDLKLLLRDSPYFTSDTNVTAIKSQIKGDYLQAEPGGSDNGESVRQGSLLFLKMAQLCDEQNEGIDLALKDLDKRGDRLVSSLRGLENVVGGEGSDAQGPDKDSGMMMTGRRIRAWTACMAGVIKKQERPLFITTSEAVFDWLESNSKDVVNVLDIEKIKVHENECNTKKEWQNHLYDYLMGLLYEDGNREKGLQTVDDKCLLFGQIKLNLFSGNDINKLFNCSDKKIPVCLIKLK